MRVFIALNIILLLASCSKTKNDQNLESYESVDEFILKAEKNKSKKIDSALFYAQQAHRISQREQYDEGIAKSALIIGEICHHKGEFNQANEYLIESLQKLKEMNAELELGQVYNLLGRVYQYSDQWDLAFDYYKKALVTFSDNDHQKGVAETYGNLGHFNEKKGIYDSAIYYQNQAIQIYSSLNDSSGLARIYDNIGSIYEDLEQYEKAGINFNNAYQINSNLKNQVEALVNYNNIGDIFRKTDQLSKALQISSEVLKRAKELDQPYQIRSAYRDIG